jgi:hypothetical protein
LLLLDTVVQTREHLLVKRIISVQLYLFGLRVYDLTFLSERRRSDFPLLVHIIYLFKWLHWSIIKIAISAQTADLRLIIMRVDGTYNFFVKILFFH